MLAELEEKVKTAEQITIDREALIKWRLSGRITLAQYIDFALEIALGEGRSEVSATWIEQFSEFWSEIDPETPENSPEYKYLIKVNPSDVWAVFAKIQKREEKTAKREEREAARVVTPTQLTLNLSF